MFKGTETLLMQFAHSTYVNLKYNIYQKRIQEKFLLYLMWNLTAAIRAEAEVSLRDPKVQGTARLLTPASLTGIKKRIHLWLLWDFID